MGQSTQQNAAMVEESSAASRTLAGEVATLAQQTSKFRITAANIAAMLPRPALTTASASVH